MEFVLTPSVPEIRSGVIKCITRVAQSCKHRRQLETTDFFQLSHIIYSILFILLCVCVCVCGCLTVCLAESCKVLHEQDVETVLVELLSLENIGVMTSACQAVAALTFHLNSKERFRELGTYIFTKPP